MLCKTPGWETEVATVIMYEPKKGTLMLSSPVVSDCSRWLPCYWRGHTAPEPSPLSFYLKTSWEYWKTENMERCQTLFITFLMFITLNISLKGLVVHEWPKDRRSKSVASRDKLEVTKEETKEGESGRETENRKGKKKWRRLESEILDSLKSGWCCCFSLLHRNLPILIHLQL